MDLRQIIYFMRVYEERNFTKASLRVNIAQPALSKQISLLEKELKAKLFERGQQGSRPTAVATEFYNAMAPLVANIAVVKQQILDRITDGNLSGSFNCGFPSSFSQSIVGKVLAEFVDEHPNVEINVMEGYTATLADWVRSGKLDFALGGTSDMTSVSASDIIIDEEVALISGQPIAGPPFRPCRLDQIPGLKLVTPAIKNITGGQLHAHIKAGLFKPERCLELDSFSATLDMVRNSDWACVMPSSGLLEEMQRKSLFIYPIESPTIKYSLQLLRNQTKPLSIAASVFLDRIVARASAARNLWENCKNPSVRDNLEPPQE